MSRLHAESLLGSRWPKKDLVSFHPPGRTVDDREFRRGTDKAVAALCQRGGAIDAAVPAASGQASAVQVSSRIPSVGTPAFAASYQ